MSPLYLTLDIAIFLISVALSQHSSRAPKASLLRRIFITIRCSHAYHFSTLGYLYTYILFGQLCNHRFVT